MGAPAYAAHGLIGVVVVVVDGQLFALANPAQTHIDNVPLKNAGDQVGRAGVDELGA